jgi:hypothetical protein
VLVKSPFFPYPFTPLPSQTLPPYTGQPPSPSYPSPPRRIRAEETLWTPPAFEGTTAAGVNPMALALGPLRAPTRAGTTTGTRADPRVRPKHTDYATHLPDHNHAATYNSTTAAGATDNPMQVPYGPQRRTSLTSLGTAGSAYTGIWKHALEQDDRSEASASIWPESDDDSHAMRMEQIYVESDKVFTAVMVEIREAERQRYNSATGPSVLGGPSVADVVKAFETTKGIEERRQNLYNAKSKKAKEDASSPQISNT